MVAGQKVEKGVLREREEFLERRFVSVNPKRASKETLETKSLVKDPSTPNKPRQNGKPRARMDVHSTGSKTAELAHQLFERRKTIDFRGPNVTDQTQTWHVNT